MDKYFNATNLQEYLQDIFTWIQIHALNLDNGVQLGVVVGGGGWGVWFGDTVCVAGQGPAQQV